jgi:hypothetical protein
MGWPFPAQEALKHKLTMNETDQYAQIQAQAYTPPPFPTWPPPSGGAPVTTPELGPITNPFPYGSAQTANISTSPPAPAHPYKATFYPQKMPTGATGQNQNQKLPTWPHARFNTLPDKASPSISAITPAPLMGPAPQAAQMARWEDGVDPGNPFPAKRWPTGSYIDGYGNVITPTRVVGGLGN